MNDNSQKKYDYLFKILLVGDSGVGKTSTLLRFTDQTFSQIYMSTIGCDFKMNNITLGEKVIKLQLWDSAGQERFGNISQTYFRSADGVLLFFDLTNKSSFDNLGKWINNINTYKTKDVSVLLVGNKTDLENREVDKDTVEKFAEELGVKYLEISAKEGTNVDKSFYALTNEIKKKAEENADKKIENAEIPKNELKIRSGREKNICC